MGRRWDRTILDTLSYGAFTRQMLILSQLRTGVTLAQLKAAPGVLPLSASCTAAGVASGAAVPASNLARDWAVATSRAEMLAAAAGLKLDDFAKITAYEFYGDFHRTVYAGELALRDMGPERVRQYKVLMAVVPANLAPIVHIGELPSDQNAVHVAFQNQFRQVFAILKGLGPAERPFHHRPERQEDRQCQPGWPAFQLIFN